jgi:beta-glucosidase
MKKQLLTILFLLFSINLLGQNMPFQNPELRSEERAKDLLSRLTLIEKAALMCDVSDAIPRLGIKKLIGGVKHCMALRTMAT